MSTPDTPPNGTHGPEAAGPETAGHPPRTVWQAWTKRDTLVGGVLLAVIAGAVLLAVSGDRKSVV